MHFAHPHFLWTLLILVPLTVWYVLRLRNSHATMSLSTTTPFAHLPRTWKQYLRHVLFALRMATLACLIVVMARPQERDSWRTTSTEGTDIVIALDVSSSMMARDFDPDRFEAAKSVASQFVAGRPNDNIGIVVFAGESLTGLPMTMDRSMLLSYLSNLQMGILEDGTAIGDGIATSLNRLRDGQAASKSIILLTDGSNNTGVIAPVTASEVAKEMGVKIYTIGVGRNGTAPYPVRTLSGRIEYQPQPVVIDEATLRTIAESTGGRYFRATDKEKLRAIYDEINQLEKSKVEITEHVAYHELFLGWLLWAAGLLVVEFLVATLLLKRIP